MALEHQDHSLNDRYLWDGSGQPDPEIERLEFALARFRNSQPAPVFTAIELAEQRMPWWSRIALSVWAPRCAAACLVVFAVGCGLWLAQSPGTSTVARNGWDVRVSGASQQSESGEERVAAESGRLELGETLETDSATKASVTVAEVGRIEVEPMTRLRLLQSGAGRKRIALDRGTIHATIWAPPGQFVVDTPSAVAVDLGCMYTLHIDDSGSGILHTTLGWVGFHRDGHESFIPAGAACPTHVQSGPGTPYFEDASDTFRSALAQLDALDVAPFKRQSAFDIVLREARSRDAFTLWHLLSRVTSAERPAVYDRLASLVPPSPDVTREGILHLDSTMLDTWWNAFDLGDISLWRHWEQSWTGREGQSK
jgi:FecR protein